jgi:hypothetical protein
LNFYYYHRFSMKHLLHFRKLWTICHFISIQTTNVACVWRCLLWFLTWLCYLLVAIVVCSFFFLHVFTLWFVIPQFVQYLLVFPILLYIFAGVTCLVLCGTKSALLAFVVVMPSSHNIVTSLCYCSVDYFIPVVIIMRYDYNLL